MKTRSRRPTVNEQLRHERLRRGWSLNRAAQELHDLAARQPNLPELRADANTFSRWELRKNEPQPHHVTLLCQLYGKSAYELGLADRPPAESAGIPVTVGPVSCSDGLVLHVGGAYDEVVTFVVKRREFLRTLAEGSGAVLLTDLYLSDTLRMKSEALSATGRAALAESLNLSIAASWTLFHTADTERMTAVSRAQLYLLHHHASTLDSNHAASLFSTAYRLAGAIDHRRGRYHDALRAHQAAYLAALDAGMPGTWRKVGAGKRTACGRLVVTAKPNPPLKQHCVSSPSGRTR